jgi:RNA-directed DNA polymerase
MRMMDLPCGSEVQAERLKDAIARRFAACFLTLHPQKTKIAYCRDDRRRGAYATVQFDFLGYTFRPRAVRGTGGGLFFGFNPGISTKSAVAIRQTMRSWRLHRRSDLTLEEIARTVNPTIRGWINYYGAYYKTALAPVMAHFDKILSRWAMRKYKSLMRQRNAHRWVRSVAGRQPALFAHWASFGAAAG